MWIDQLPEGYSVWFDLAGDEQLAMVVFGAVLDTHLHNLIDPSILDPADRTERPDEIIRQIRAVAGGDSEPPVATPIVRQAELKHSATIVEARLAVSFKRERLGALLTLGDIVDARRMTRYTWAFYAWVIGHYPDDAPRLAEVHAAVLEQCSWYGQHGLLRPQVGMAPFAAWVEAPEAG